MAADSSNPNTKDYKKLSDEELKKKVSAEQFYVIRNEGTERPFHNAYWNNHEAGIYVDASTGEPLFSSIDKYDSGTGWPSFTKPIKKDAVKMKTDKDGNRTEVRSQFADSHLGHVFNDGPGPTGERYCMNSAALKFIPLKDLEKDGYKEFLPLFKDAKNPAKK